MASEWWPIETAPMDGDYRVTRDYRHNRPYTMTLGIHLVEAHRPQTLRARLWRMILGD